MRIRRTLGTLALASTLMLAGCGDDGDNDGDNDAQPSETPSETPTPTEDATEEETEEAEGDSVDIEEFLDTFEEGVEATTTARMTMQMDVQGQELEIDGEVDYTTDPATMAMKMSGGTFGDGTIEMRVIDGTVYMNLGPASQDKFLKLSLEQLGAQAGLGNLTDQLDPSAQLESFRDGLTEVEFVGEEEIEGEDVEHYALVVDSSQLQDQTAGLPENMELDVWLDDEGRLVRTTSDLGPLGEITANVFDFGAEVDIEKPALSEIQQLPSA